MLKEKLHSVIFGTETKAGRRYDLILLIFILISVLVVMIESVPATRINYGPELFIIEWVFTILFTLEYIVRILISPKPLKYIFSVWGAIDLLAILPTFISPFFSGYHSFIVIRALRLLRIFRILKLSRFMSESNMLYHSLKASSYKITVFLFFVTMMIVIAGTLMYVIEGGDNGFNSIPQSIYWAVVTITTVGYGDISPVTAFGKFIASVMMITGYGIIAIPTGLITVELARYKDSHAKKCKECEKENAVDSKFCNECGNKL